MAAGRGISDGPSSHPLEDTVSGSAPGIPDDALSPGETLEDAIGAPDDDASAEELRKRVFGEGS